jgi:hypothetical protein
MRRLPPAIAGLVVVWSAAIAAQLSGAAAIARTETVLQHLQSGNAAALVKLLDEKMLAALPEEKLKAVWPSVAGQFGAFKSITERREGQLRDRQAVELVLAFEKETIVMRVVFDAEGRVGGLVFRPLSGAVLPPAKK